MALYFKLIEPKLISSQIAKTIIKNKDNKFIKGGFAKIYFGLIFFCTNINCFIY